MKFAAEFLTAASLGRVPSDFRVGQMYQYMNG